MAARINVGAAAPGQVTPRSDNARRQPGVEGDRTADSGDYAEKLIATAAARAALLGIEVHQLGGGAWLLRHASGANIGAVRGLAALDAALGGFEAAQHDVRELVQRMRGAA
jgi:hypothetical protein